MGTFSGSETHIVFRCFFHRFLDTLESHLRYPCAPLGFFVRSWDPLESPKCGKAHSAAKESQVPSLADDSGITIDALNGAPGVYTADWAETSGGRDFVYAMEKTQNALAEVDAAHPRAAQFRCTLVLAWPDGHDEVFEGMIAGSLVWPMRGENGHGYDPIFLPDGYNLTFGEMDRWEKNKISHRADAFTKLLLGCF